MAGRKIQHPVAYLAHAYSKINKMMKRWIKRYKALNSIVEHVWAFVYADDFKIFPIRYPPLLSVCSFLSIFFKVNHLNSLVIFNMNCTSVVSLIALCFPLPKDIFFR
jgi:hypothetical protein